MIRLAIAKLLPFAALACLALSCANAPEETDEPEKKPPDERPVLVGRIASIPPGGGFVLIQSYGTWQVPDGRILTTRGPDERAANLLVTGEKLGQFAAADVRSGEVVVGDAVFMPPAQPRPAPWITSTAAQETPEEGGSEDEENAEVETPE